jgi:hypothetical protein
MTARVCYAVLFAGSFPVGVWLAEHLRWHR